VSNTLLTTSYIVNTGLEVLENDLVFSDKVNRQYSDEFAIKEAKIGATVNIRRPPRYLGTFGPALNVEDTNETYVPVSLTNQFHVDVQFTTADLLLSMDLFKTRVLKPMLAAVANRLDSDGAYFAYQQTPRVVGTFGTAPSSYLTYANANALLSAEACPPGDRYCVLDPLTMAAATDGVKGLFNPQAQIGSYVEKGVIAKKFAGLDWYEDQNIPSMTATSSEASQTVSATRGWTGTPVLAGATSVAGGTALLTSGWAQTGTFEISGLTSGSTIRVGDIVQVKGVYPVNPQSRSQYGNVLKQFVVLPPGGYAINNGAAAAGGPPFAAATLANGTFAASTGIYSSTGLLTLTVGECLISGGQFQNASNAPVSTYTVTCNNSLATQALSPQGIVMHRNAFALAFADLPLPRGVEMAARAADDDLGMSIRMVTQYTINNDAMPTRCDILYGWSSLYRSLAVRVAG
jgi:P22 coat protein - gene protein 5